MVEIEDASGFRGEAERIVTPASEAELLAVIAAASRERIPITIGGARTGLTGGCVPQGGWAVSLEKLRCLESCPGRAIVGPGVSLDALQRETPPPVTPWWKALLNPASRGWQRAAG